MVTDAAPALRPSVPEDRSPAPTGPWWERIPSGAWTALLLLVAVAAWELGARSDWWPTALVPSLSRIIESGVEEMGSGGFVPHLRSTTLATLLSYLAGTGFGGALGVLFWRRPRLGQMFEPYLVSFYAVPLVVFYPVALVVLGINNWPIVILASVMAMIPMSLNTWVGLAGIRPVHLRLAESLCASRRDTFVQVALPAAAKLIYTGMTLAAIYALIGVVAMEFMVAQHGLGSRIRYLYEDFDNSTMYFYILTTLVVSVVMIAVLSAVSKRLLGKEIR
jgi:NitT/TauT family transport system permease protein